MRVSICMPVYNQQRIVEESIKSALNQEYPDKEIVVIDDCSTDQTLNVCARHYPAIRLYRNETNLGLAGNLDMCVKKSTGDIIVLLCGDDIFTNPYVITDMVKVFKDNKDVGVVGRYYYQYLDGYKGAVMTIRSDIYTSSCQPSGVGFRRSAIGGNFSSKLFVEVPSMVKNIINNGWKYYIIKYDTIAARLHPGVKGNAATNPGYYNVTPRQSPVRNWYEITGKPMGMYMGLIQIKNRAPWLLIGEITETIKINPRCLLNIGFWFCTLVALLVPGWILRRLSNWYRHRITRRFCKIIERTQ